MSTGTPPEDFELRTAMITADFLAIRLARARLDLAAKELALAEMMVDAGTRTTYDASWVKRTLPFEFEVLLAQEVIGEIETHILMNAKEIEDLTRVEVDEPEQRFDEEVRNGSL